MRRRDFWDDLSVSRSGDRVRLFIIALTTVLLGAVLSVQTNLIPASLSPAWLNRLKGWPLGISIGVVILLLAFLGLVSQARGKAGARPTTAVPVLDARYDDTSSQYRHPYSNQPWISEHRVGVFNPGPDPVSHVRVHLVSMSQPRHVLPGYEPVIPYLVPMLPGRDSSIGMTLTPGTEELWVIGYTATGSDGSLQAGRFAPPNQRWHGLPMGA